MKNKNTTKCLTQNEIKKISGSDKSCTCYSIDIDPTNPHIVLGSLDNNKNSILVNSIDKCMRNCCKTTASITTGCSIMYRFGDAYDSTFGYCTP